MNTVPSVAIYARLSLEDRDILKRNSSSITNQIEICKRYILDHNMVLAEIYIDDGVSGTTYDRPGFNALLEGIKRKLFNTVIVKDLSRLGRNFLKSSYYIEEFFPENNIRFIAINDSYDSFLSTDGEMLIAISNYLNDFYAKECRKKRMLYYERVKDKESFSSTGGSYGYIIENKVITVDPVAARVVRKIFRMRIAGSDKTEIANYLTRRKILTPMEYKKKRQGKPYKLVSWNDSKVGDILANPIYTGDSYNLRVTSANGKRRKMPIEKRILVKNTHEAIITKKEWKLTHDEKFKCKSKRNYGEFDKLVKFFYDLNGYVISADKNYHPRYQCGKLCVYYREYYHSRFINYLCTTKFAHNKIYAMALDVVKQIKEDSEAFYNLHISIYKKGKPDTSNKSLYIKERDELNEKIQLIFEENVSKGLSKDDFNDKVASISQRIKEIDEILFKFAEIDYLEKDYRSKLSKYIKGIKEIDESMNYLELVQTVFKSCIVIKKTIKDIKFIPKLNL